MDDITKILGDSNGAADLLAINPRHFVALERSRQIGPMRLKLGRLVIWSVEALIELARKGCMGQGAWLKAKRER